MHQVAVILDFGGPAGRFIAEKVRECGVYCEVLPHDVPGKTVTEKKPKAIILAGGQTGAGPALFCAPEIFDCGVPILGVSCPCAAEEDSKKKIFVMRYLPEGDHADSGMRELKSFLFDISGLSRCWDMAEYVERTIEELKEKIGDKTALCALSGGVDSAVAAVMAHRAIGDGLTCIFVDHGLLRKNEADDVMRTLSEKFRMKIIKTDARERFLSKLAGVCQPEKKRKIVGEEFIRVFEEEAEKAGGAEFLIQGTIYPDIIESGSGNSDVIKSHHNVGGLPDTMSFSEIIEPLRPLFKNEVRKAGIVLGLDEETVRRQPFPGPGLAVRVVGEVTEEKLAIVREADAVFREEIIKAGLHGEINQYFAALTDMRSVGVTGDSRTYDRAIALRAVTTSDFMTADFARIPYEVLERVSQRIVNEVKQVNRVFYDVTPKPPATIELE
ncbi:MAG: glutamine-hydrolyzing GMP synthase [Oscillospiraceae bacterium]|nr:glutamine-hydrolyzing GMP synthase [Oscillospiraceae bacterium]